MNNALCFKYACMLLSLLLVAALSGCSAIGGALNPYKSEFSCPMSDQGLCIGMADAYDKAIGADSGAAAQSAKDKKRKSGTEPAAACDLSGKRSASETVYEKASYQKLAGLLREPVTPIVAPPKVMRVLLLPYKSGENDLYMLRYAYFFVDDPKWVFGDYLNSEGE